MVIYTYLIKSIRKGGYYTGISENPQKRLIEHNSGKLRSTSRDKPFTLVYYRKHVDYQEARKHEIWLKKKNKEYKSKLYLPP